MAVETGSSTPRTHCKMLPTIGRTTFAAPGCPMAGEWIKMTADLRTSPKVVRIASALNADRLRVVGALHAVWCLFDVHSEDGTLNGYTLAAIDELIGWPGFSKAMADVQWLAIGP